MSTQVLSRHPHRSQPIWSRIAAILGRFLNRLAATNARNGKVEPFGL
jgi:hypothetical protein